MWRFFKQKNGVIRINTQVNRYSKYARSKFSTKFVWSVHFKTRVRDYQQVLLRMPPLTFGCMLLVKAPTLTDLQQLTWPMGSTSASGLVNGGPKVEWSSHKRPQYLPKKRKRRAVTLSPMALVDVCGRAKAALCVCVFACMCMCWVVGGGSVDREGWREMDGRAGPPQLPRESPEPRFIQLLR